METGDLVKHKNDGSYGIVVEVRETQHTVLRRPCLCVVYWFTQNCSVLHRSSQLETINEE